MLVMPHKKRIEVSIAVLNRTTSIACVAKPRRLASLVMDLISAGIAVDCDFTGLLTQENDRRARERASLRKKRKEARVHLQDRRRAHQG